MEEALVILDKHLSTYFAVNPIHIYPVIAHTDINYDEWLAIGSRDEYTTALSALPLSNNSIIGKTCVNDNTVDNITELYTFIGESIPKILSSIVERLPALIDNQNRYILDFTDYTDKVNNKFYACSIKRYYGNIPLYIKYSYDACRELIHLVIATTIIERKPKDYILKEQTEFDKFIACCKWR